MLENMELESLLEAIILAAEKPMNEEALLKIFDENEKPSKTALRDALTNLQENSESRGIRLVEVASGYQFQVKPEFNNWVAKLHEEKAPRYSRALFETLALIAYRQPITRGEIEDIRGVSLSTSIFKTLLEDREWIRIVGHREVPGRPALYATTKSFLDYFGLKTLDELPSLPEIMNLETVASNHGILLPESLQAPIPVQVRDEENEVDVDKENEKDPEKGNQDRKQDQDNDDLGNEDLELVAESSEEEVDNFLDEDMDNTMELKATSKEPILADELFGDSLESEEEEEFLEDALEPTFEMENIIVNDFSMISDEVE